MPFSTYLFFPGTCREAMTRYAQVLNLPVPDFMTGADMPPDVLASMPDLPATAVMHSMLTFDGSVLMASDETPTEAQPMAGCSVNLTVADADEAARVFTALSEGGQVRMPLAPAFWTPAFGTLTDRFGVRWMVMAEMQP